MISFAVAQNLGQVYNHNQQWTSARLEKNSSLNHASLGRENFFVALGMTCEFVCYPGKYVDERKTIQ
jgi:hypothetical protein